MTAEVTFPPSMRRFASMFAFYSDDVRRANSPEADYGIFWWDGPQGHSATWKVSAIEATGEIYACRVHGYRRRDEEQVVLLGKIADADPGYLKADAVLEGWNLVCGQSASLEWAIDRVLAADDVVPAPLSILCRHQTLGGHVHVDLFVGRMAGKRGKAGELILHTREWAEFLAALRAGFGDRLELAERADAVDSASAVRQERLA